MMAEKKEAENKIANNNGKVCCLYRIGNRTVDPEQQIIYLDGVDNVTLGRAEDNDVELRECLTVSRKHGQLVKTEAGWAVKDLGSGNGIHINHLRIPAQTTRLLVDRDIVEIGKNPTEEGLAVYTFQFFLKAKIQKKANCPKSRPPLLSTQNTLNGSKDAKETVKNRFTSPSTLVKQKLIEQERRLREEMQEKENERLKEMEERIKQKEEEQAKTLEELRLQREAVEKELEEQKLKQQQEMDREKLQLQEKLEQQKEEQERLAKQQKEFEERLKQSEDEKVEMEEKLRLEAEKKAKEVEEQEKLEEKLKELQKCHQEQLENAQKEAQSVMEELEVALQSKMAREAELEQEREAFRTQAEEERLKFAAEKEALERKLAVDLENQLKLENDMEEVRGLKRKLEEDLKTEMNKKLKEKDEEATMVINKKEEELRNLLQEKEKEYETLQEQLKVKAKEEVQSNVEVVMEDELLCAICSELMVQAVLLNCSHTFCHLCITRWMDTKKPKAPCPNCRKPITSFTRSLMLDNFIDKAVSVLKDELKDRRKQLVAERKVEQEQYDKQVEQAKVQKQQQQQQAAARGRPRVTANGALPLEHYLTQVGHHVFLNTPPSGTAATVAVVPASSSGQTQTAAAGQAVVSDISPWLRQYLSQAMTVSGASPQLPAHRPPAAAAQPAALPRRVPQNRALNSGAQRTQPTGHVSGRNATVAPTQAAANPNPFAINLQGQRRPGESENNPIVVPGVNDVVGRNHSVVIQGHRMTVQQHNGQQIVARQQHAHTTQAQAAVAQQNTGRRAQTTNTRRQQYVPATQTQAGYVQQNTGHHAQTTNTRQHYAPTTQVQGAGRHNNRGQNTGTRAYQAQATQQAAQSRPTNRPSNTTQSRRGYTQHGNPPVWQYD